jgi:hypothetical protein
MSAPLPLAAKGHLFEGLGLVEWVLVGIAIAAAAWVIWRAVILTIRPGEEDPEHIKRQVLREDASPGDRLGSR